ncbi:rhamnulokinase family protein [Actinospica sp.]|uniref:rhamnulokinase n=1 Tax=Actinospica sp. TaxID=1872142 RepID=UPI002BF10A24|nr:rhamnulokinase family protein [Actinospica sp.]HWG25063.1 rhamnulokinase family protein [Actinospica sp.]
MNTRAFGAVDLGATSGRVMLGRVGPGVLELTEAHRFPNTPINRADGLYWDFAALLRGTVEGLCAAQELSGERRLDSVGIDSWAVDYGLLDADGTLVEDPHHYRDPRTSAGLIASVHERITAEQLYEVTGLQHLPFNTVFQLAAAMNAPRFTLARTILPIPDLVTYRLTGTVGAEETNASTTGLFDATTRTWSKTVVGALGLDPTLLPPLRGPGTSAGTLLPGLVGDAGLAADTPVTVVASHDTASAVAAVPATGPGFAYISCGTWSLVGLELSAPVLTPASRRANFTNELGVDGTVRYLRNVMGLWLLSESQRTWAGRGLRADTETVLRQAAAAEPFGRVVDPDDPAFLAPGDIPGRIEEFCRRSDQRPPRSPGETVRCILESLAIAHRQALRRAAELADQDVDIVHLVGGGSRNELLCQWTADATGLPVIAGPTEAAAIGNALVQARAQGVIGDLSSMRRLVAETQQLRRYVPSGDRAAWDAAAARVAVT